MKKYRRNKNEKQYIPRNPENYVGSYPIVCRSKWEEKMCMYLDYNKFVTEWSSESHVIPYFDPVQGKKRRYYPDFYARIRGKRYIIEVKPLKDMRLPRKGNKSKKTLVMREQTYITNNAKFKAAEVYCKKLGYEFVIITEKDLFGR